jgi:hypothetical protein
LSRSRAPRPVLQRIFITCNELNEQNGCALEFDAAVYCNELLREFLGQAVTFMRAAARDPDASLKELIEAEGVGAALRARNSRPPSP